MSNLKCRLVKFYDENGNLESKVNYLDKKIRKY